MLEEVLQDHKPNWNFQRGGGSYKGGIFWELHNPKVIRLGFQCFQSLVFSPPSSLWLRDVKLKVVCFSCKILWRT